MKRDSRLFASLVLMLATGLILYLAGDMLTEEKAYALGAEVLHRQLGSVAVIGMGETRDPEESVSPAPSSTPAEPVPVTTVAEAWDELAREKQEAMTSPQPVTVDAAGTLEVRNETGYAIELENLPALPALEVLQAGQPVVLIMHTHGSESYTDEGVSGYRTQDETKSVIAVGEEIRAVLEQRGYAVFHDKTFCDYPEYSGAYNRSRTVIQAALEQYPGIFLVLDIHRDAVEDSGGGQMRMACSVNGQDAAQLMLVVGTDAGGLSHPGWQYNLSLGAVLQMELSGSYPGLMRPLNLRTERFNQDLAPLTLLVEVGASGNTLSEAIFSAKLFAGALSGVLDACGGKSS